MTKTTQNQFRASRADLTAAVLYDDEARGGHAALVEMIGDIMHSSRYRLIDFDQALESARKQYQEEIKDEVEAWSVRSGPVADTLDMAKSLAKLQGEGIFNSAIDDVLADTKRQIDELIAIARESALDDEDGEAV